MASMAARSGGLLRSLRGKAKAGTLLSSGKRSFSAAAHDDAHETAKWEKITYAGIATCTVLAFYNLSKGHPHHEEPPAYTYLHIRNKEFPWGPDGLFEEKKHADHYCQVPKPFPFPSAYLEELAAPMARI